jgi:membrane protease YdiL (CAAX protease family)
MKYFRSYPWGMQLLLFLMMIVTMMGVGMSVLFMLLPKFSNYSYDQLVKQLATINEHSPAQLIKTALIVQGVSNLFLFIVPALLFSYLSHPQPGPYLGLKAPGKKIQILLTILVMLGAAPVLQLFESLVGLIDFGTAIKEKQALNNNMMSAFLNMPDLASFIRVFIIVAVMPAFGEEIFFRGVMLRFAKKRSRTMVFPIVFTSAVFAYTHSNIYGLLSIFFAGILLAVIYNLTGSLWCSIVGHLFFNGIQVILSYAGNNNTAVKAFMSSDFIPWYLVVGGAVIFAGSFYLLLKNKTPLPPDWAEDFTQVELAEQNY